MAWFATIFAVVVLLSGATGALTAKRIMTRADAMVMRNAVIINEGKIKPGDPVFVSYNYDKRADWSRREATLAGWPFGRVEPDGDRHVRVRAC